MFADWGRAGLGGNKAAETLRWNKGELWLKIKQNVGWSTVLRVDCNLSSPDWGLRRQPCFLGNATVEANRTREIKGGTKDFDVEEGKYFTVGYGGGRNPNGGRARGGSFITDRSAEQVRNKSTGPWALPHTPPLPLCPLLYNAYPTLASPNERPRLWAVGAKD